MTLSLVLLATMSCIGWLLRCDGFLLGESCLVPAPCTFSGFGPISAKIDCDDKSLNVTPYFLKTDRHVVTQLYVKLAGNQLTTIPNYAFKNLSSISARSIFLYLDRNKISTIDRYAFSGIENVNTTIHLENNNLSSIPVAVYNHHALTHLYIQNNSIKSLNGFSHSGLGHTLHYLQIDLNEFTSWPSELNSLNVLKTLKIAHLNVQHTNSDAFRGFENSLESLDISYVPYLEKFPSAVCQLSNLGTLTLNYFTNLNENSTSIFDLCSKRLNKVWALYLRYNDLTIFPEFLHIFPAITGLYLEWNSLDIIELEKIPTDNILSFLQLDNNKFKRIPYALNRVKNLKTLFMQSNDISSIEENDLTDLVHLTNLFLTNNPIKYISTHAFRNNNELANINLFGTSLRTIPAAVMSLPLLNFIDMRTKVHIQCTCDLSYLKGWNATAVRYFLGDCSSTGIKIQGFIMTSLQNCP